MGFTGQIALVVGWNWSDDDETSADHGQLNTTKRIGDGNDADEAEAVWHLADQDILASGTVTHDLTALHRYVFEALHTTSLVTVRAIAVKSSADSEGNLVVGAAASNTWWAPFGASTDSVVLLPGSMFVVYETVDGWTVDSTHKNLKLAAVGGDVTYDIALIGTLTESGSDSSSS